MKYTLWDIRTLKREAWKTSETEAWKVSVSDDEGNHGSHFQLKQELLNIKDRHSELQTLIF